MFRHLWVRAALHHHKAREEAWRIFQLWQRALISVLQMRCTATSQQLDIPDSHLCELPSVCGRRSMHQRFHDRAAMAQVPVMGMSSLAWEYPRLSVCEKYNFSLMRHIGRLRIWFMRVCIHSAILCLGAILIMMPGCCLFPLIMPSFTSLYGIQILCR